MIFIFFGVQGVEKKLQQKLQSCSDALVVKWGTNCDYMTLGWGVMNI